MKILSKVVDSVGVGTGIQLIESMYATREDGVRHLQLHLERLAASAVALSFRLDACALRSRLLNLCSGLSEQTPYRLRVVLAADGATEITHAPLTPLNDGSALVLPSDEHGFSATASEDPLLLHKTTRREIYDCAWREAESLGAFDMLFFNERDELAEGGRSNVFVKLNGRWWTPPISSGLLPGVMRGVLMEKTELNVTLRVLSRQDLLRADELIVCNALRGALKAELIHRR